MPDSQHVDIPATELPSTRDRPRIPARVAFLDRHLVSQLVDQLLPRCHIPGCSRVPRVEHVHEFQQLWSIRISCGEMEHGWTFVTGEMEPYRGAPLVTPLLYHSTLCSGLTYTALASICSHLGLHVPTSKHWLQFQTGHGRPGGGWIQAIKEQWAENKSLLWSTIQADLSARSLRGEPG